MFRDQESCRRGGLHEGFRGLEATREDSHGSGISPRHDNLLRLAWTNLALDSDFVPLVDAVSRPQEPPSTVSIRLFTPCMSRRPTTADDSIFTRPEAMTTPLEAFVRTGDLMCSVRADRKHGDIGGIWCMLDGKDAYTAS